MSVKNTHQGAAQTMEYRNSDIADTINEYVHSERDRKILKGRLIDGRSFSELSAEFFLSDRQIKKIVYRYQRKIFDMIDQKAHE
jgi:hypothetical protein